MGRPKVSKEEAEHRIKNRFPQENFEILEYNGSGGKCKVQYKNCNHIIEINSFTNFLAKNKAHGCKNCKGLWIEREKRIAKIREFYDIIKVKIIKTHSYYTVRCKDCGHIRTTTLGNFMKNLLCGCRTGVVRGRTEEEFLTMCNENCREGKYILLSQYINQTTPVTIQHSCGHRWTVRPSDVIKGRSFCPKCGREESRGESLVRKILDSFNIKYQQEYRLKGTQLRLDFLLENIDVGIEYQGKQHFVEVDFFCDSLTQRQNRDRRKREWCAENSITLVEIPYTKDTFEKIIDFIGSTTIQKWSTQQAIGCGNDVNL